MDDDEIRRTVRRLARPAPGGHVVERVALVAEGSNAEAIERWIVEHGGTPEAAAPRSAKGGGGLFAERAEAAEAERGATIARYVMPPGSLDADVDADAEGTPDP
ncbi:MAG TPA: hypothetical protein VIL49_00370 [Capillimicrobium sp.]|jgi:hypothetical protein